MLQTRESATSAITTLLLRYLIIGKQDDDDGADDDIDDDIDDDDDDEEEYCAKSVIAPNEFCANKHFHREMFNNSCSYFILSSILISLSY